MLVALTLQVLQPFLQIHLPSLHNFDVNWPNSWVTLEELQGDKFCYLCLNSGAVPFFSSNLNSLILSNRATWDNREMIWRDANSIFQRRFRELCCYLIILGPCYNKQYLHLFTFPFQPPSSILAQVQLLNPVPIHTISFNCADTEANQFLCQLAAETGGR